jgi:ubiquinone/menaquinone biosynthesis C-methylase UbiE
MKKRLQNYDGPAQAWDDHWRKSPDESSFTGNADTHPVLVSTWRNLFSLYGERASDIHFIDIATGGGIVVRCANDVFGNNLPSTSALDISDHAIDRLTERFPGVEGVVADAAAIPLDSCSFDLVTSQFGIEYAGISAVYEAARLVSDGGHLALILHCRPGGIYAECSSSLKAIDRLRQSKFIPLATDMFKAGFATFKGEDSHRYKRATHKFRAAYRVTDQLVSKYGAGVASGMIARLGNDTEQIRQRLPNYDLNDVLTWLGQFNEELLAYRGRMKSMTKAAIDQPRLEGIAAKLSASGFSITEMKPLIDETDQNQLAWWLLAQRN